MSEFDLKEEPIIEGTLKIDDVDNSYLHDRLGKINSALLEGLAKKLSFSEAFHEHAWKHNFFGNVGWRKAL